MDTGSVVALVMLIACAGISLGAGWVFYGRARNRPVCPSCHYPLYRCECGRYG